MKRDPYHQALKSYRAIERKLAPISKVRALLRVAEKVISSIKLFYQLIGVEFNGELDSDDTVSLFIYFIVKSGLKNLYSHLDFANNFLSESSMQGISGYYVETQFAALTYIEE